jgi:hypothetical protein
MAKLASRSRAATSAPRLVATAVKVTFSSWPVSALVAGEKIGRGRRSLSTSPRGIGSPASVALCLYSAHADPEM